MSFQLIPLRNEDMEQYLQWLIKTNSEKDINLLVEPIVPDAPNMDQRFHRLEFYKKNDIISTGYELQEKDGIYDILSPKPKSFSPASLNLLLRHACFGLYAPKITKEVR